MTDSDTQEPESHSGEVLQDEQTRYPDLGLLSRVNVKVTVEVGQTQVTLQELIRLNEGSVVELDRIAGDPLDILVNGTPIARGEVVVVGDKFGIRFGEIVDARQRLENI
ncbi:MAG: flagellar motor switch protein FliN [Pseudomonadota bacterium]